MKTRYGFAALIDELGLKVGAEIGVRDGTFSEYLLLHSKLDILYSIDLWMGKQSGAPYKQAVSCLAHYGDRCKMIKASSEEAAREFEDASLDFVYIDADHRKRSVAKDLRAWVPKVRVGGVVSGHDYVRERMCGVIPAVNTFMLDRSEQLHTTQEHLASWWFVKDE